MKQLALLIMLILLSGCAPNPFLCALASFDTQPGHLACRYDKNGQLTLNPDVRHNPTSKNSSLEVPPTPAPFVAFGEERGWRSYDGVIGPRHQGFGPGGALELGPGGFQSIGPGGGQSIGPGGGLSIGPGGGLSIGPGGGQSIGPGGGRSIGPGGGASIGPGGGLSIGPCGGRSIAPGGGLSMFPGVPGQCN